MKGRSDFTTRPMRPLKGTQRYQAVIRFEYDATEDESQQLPWDVFNDLSVGAYNKSVSRVVPPSITRLEPDA